VYFLFESLIYVGGLFAAFLVGWAGWGEILIVVLWVVFLVGSGGGGLGWVWGGLGAISGWVGEMRVPQSESFSGEAWGGAIV
jgi:hypothetical protein